MQLIYIAVASTAGLITPEIDVGFTVQGEEARTLLIAMGAAIVPFIGIVYSLLFLVVQFGTTTFTPRLNIFRDSPIIYHSFAFFVGVLVFCFTAAFALGDEEDVSGAIPIVATVLILVALATFRTLQTSAFRSIQLAEALSQIAQRGRDVILGIYPDEFDVDGAESGSLGWRPDSPNEVLEVRWRSRSQVLQVIDVPRLMRAAEKADVLIEWVAGTGDTIPAQGVVARVHGEGNESVEKELLKSMRGGTERTFEQDPAFAFRVLADIALRALSPAVNDPTTASQALDTSDDLLRLLNTRHLDVTCVRDPDDVARVVLKLPAWEEYVALAVDELIVFGLGSPQVRARLERLLVELLEVAQPGRQPPLEQRLAQVRAGAEASA